MNPKPFKTTGEQVPRLQTPRARITSVLGFLLLGAVGTRGALTQSPTVVVAFAVFALVTVGLTMWRPTDHRVAVFRMAPLGIYFVIVGFDLLGAGHNYVIGAAGIFWLLLATVALVGAQKLRERQKSSSPPSIR